MRWLRELIHPEEKCARLGHKILARKMSGYCLPSEVTGVEGLYGRLNGAVAFRVKVTFYVCSRCGHEEVDRKEIHVGSPIHSLSLPSEWWDKLEKDGYFLRPE
jgi:hypothetical protein